MSDKRTSSSGDHTSLLTELFSNIGLAWSLIRDKRVSPWLRFGVPALALAYVVFPIDILPDVIPGMGQIDDLAAIVLAVQFIVRTVSPEIVAEYRKTSSKSTSSEPEGEYVDGSYRVVD